MSNALSQMSQLSIFQAHYSLITNQFSVFIRTFLLASHLHRHATMAQNSRADSLERRLVQFAIDIVTLVGQLPQNPQAKHIGNQILRSGTASAPNYGEARAAESRPDFIHKLKICLKRTKRNRHLASNPSGEYRG